MKEGKRKRRQCQVQNIMEILTALKEDDTGTWMQLGNLRAGKDAGNQRPTSSLHSCNPGFGEGYIDENSRGS